MSFKKVQTVRIRSAEAFTRKTLRKKYLVQQIHSVSASWFMLHLRCKWTEWRATSPGGGKYNKQTRTYSVRRAHRQGDCYHTQPARETNTVTQSLLWQVNCGYRISPSKNFGYQKRKITYRNFILLRLAEERVNHRSTLFSSCLQQQGSSNALIDGSNKPCHLPGDTETER